MKRCSVWWANRKRPIKNPQWGYTAFLSDYPRLTKFDNAKIWCREWELLNTKDGSAYENDTLENNSGLCNKFANVPTVWSSDSTSGYTLWSNSWHTSARWPVGECSQDLCV